MTLSPEIRAAIVRFIASGRMRRIPQGLRTLPAPLEAPPALCRPEGCGNGRRVPRLPGLDYFDRTRPL